MMKKALYKGLWGNRGAGLLAQGKRLENEDKWRQQDPVWSIQEGGDGGWDQGEAAVRLLVMWFQGLGDRLC